MTSNYLTVDPLKSSRNALELGEHLTSHRESSVCFDFQFCGCNGVMSIIYLRRDDYKQAKANI